MSSLFVLLGLTPFLEKNGRETVYHPTTVARYLAMMLSTKPTENLQHFLWKSINERDLDKNWNVSYLNLIVVLRCWMRVSNDEREVIFSLSSPSNTFFNTFSYCRTNLIESDFLCIGNQSRIDISEFSFQLLFLRCQSTHLKRNSYINSHCVSKESGYSQVLSNKWVLIPRWWDIRRVQKEIWIQEQIQVSRCKERDPLGAENEVENYNLHIR